MVNENQQMQIANAIDLIREVSHNAVSLDTCPPLITYSSAECGFQAVFKFHIDDYGWRAALNTHLASMRHEKLQVEQGLSRLPDIEMKGDICLGDTPKKVESKKKGKQKLTKIEMTKTINGVVPDIFKLMGYEKDTGESE